MKNNQQDYSELENELYKYFEEKKQKEVPLSTQYAIKNAFEKKNKHYLTSKIAQIILYIISIFTLVGGLVFAKDIVNLICPSFKSPRQAVTVAAENGYIQDVKSEYVYDKDIGIKIDNVVLDDSNLNITYLYDYKEKLENISIQEYKILDNNENIIYEQVEYTSKNETIANTMMRVNQQLKIEENVYNESILYGSEKFPIIEKLYIHIFSIKMKDNKIEGNWNLEVDIDPKFNKRENIEYQAEKLEHVIDSKFTMCETALTVNLEIDELYDDKSFGENRFMIEDNNGQKYICSMSARKNLDNSSIYYFKFDIGKYNENIDELLFKLKINDKTTIETKLNKQ